MFIYHIVLPDVWQQFEGKPSYYAESLQTEGFIHCSYESQLDGVIRRYYGSAESIVILKLDTEKLRSKLVKEASTGGEIYPHIYGRINRDAIAGVSERKIER